MSWFALREPVSALTHGLWAVLAVPAMIALYRRGRGSAAKEVGFLVFGACMVFCFGSSALYHAVPAGDDLHWYARLDHVGIYLMIAGSLTPAALVVLRGRWRWAMLFWAWGLALGGVWLRVAFVEVPQPLSVGLYLAMGWSILFCYFELARALSHRAMRLTLHGGVLYTVGTFLHVARWPTPWPGVVGSHDLFHLFVMAGHFCHWWFMLRVVAPYHRPGRLRLPHPAVVVRALSRHGVQAVSPPHHNPFPALPQELSGESGS